MTQVPVGRSLPYHFSALKDPRQQWRAVYPLPEILLLVLSATLPGMEDFVDIRLWGRERLAFASPASSAAIRASSASI